MDYQKSSQVDGESTHRWWQKSPWSLFVVGAHGIVGNFCWHYLSLAATFLLAVLNYLWTSGPLIFGGIVVAALATAGLVVSWFYNSRNASKIGLVASSIPVIPTVLLLFAIFNSANIWRRDNLFSPSFHRVLTIAAQEANYGTQPIRDATDLTVMELSRLHRQSSSVVVEVYGCTEGGKKLVGLPCCSAHFRAAAASRYFDISHGTNKYDWGLAGACCRNIDEIVVPSIYEIPANASYAYKDFHDLHDRENGKSVSFVLVPVLEHPSQTSGMPVGVIAISSTTPGYFSEEDLFIARALADSLSLALTNFARRDSVSSAATPTAKVGAP